MASQKDKVDFFDPSHITEPVQKAREFGINDGNPHATSDRDKWAYTTTDGDPCKWNAHVTNEKEIELQFVPLDHNIPEEHLCDGVLYTKGKERVIFIELKSGEKRWIQKGIEQLKNTLSYLDEDFINSEERVVMAYLCNSSHPHFAFSHRKEMQEFRNSERVRLYIQRDIDKF